MQVFLNTANVYLFDGYENLCVAVIRLKNVSQDQPFILRVNRQNNTWSFTEMQAAL